MDGAGVRGQGGGLHREALCPPAHGGASEGTHYLPTAAITHCYSDAVNDHSAVLGIAGMRQGCFSPGCEQPLWAKGYKDVVIHVALLEVVHDGVLVDLAEQHHVIHAAVFDILALPVVPVVPPAPLKQNTHNVQLLALSKRTQ